MKKQFAAVFFICILLISSACSNRPASTNRPLAISSPTATRLIVATKPAATTVYDPGSGGDYGAPAEIPTPRAARTPVSGAPNQAFFQDHLATADMLVVNLSGISPAPAGKTYQGWIKNEDGGLISTGTLEVQDGGVVHLEWTAPDSRNLIATTTGFLVSLEDAPGSSQLSGKVLYAGEMMPGQISLARSLFVSNTADPATPRNKAFALALVQQMSLASEHIKNAINAEAIGAAKERALHLEHVINIIEGSKGERFKDYDGDGIAENPGDGFGVMAYAGQLAAKLNQESITTKTQEVLVALLGIEQEAIAILENQPGAITLADLRTHFDEININLVFELYSLSEQAVAFKINPISTP